LRSAEWVKVNADEVRGQDGQGVGAVGAGDGGTLPLARVSCDVARAAVVRWRGRARRLAPGEAGLVSSLADLIGDAVPYRGGAQIDDLA